MPESGGFFRAAQRAAIAAAIAEAQSKTSGKIRVYVEPGSGGDIAARARQVFESLGLHKAKLQNGALLYVASQEGRLFILGGEGITRKVPPDFWDYIRDGVQEHFRSGLFLEGVLFFVKETGERLRAYFPQRRLRGMVQKGKKKVHDTRKDLMRRLSTRRARHLVDKFYEAENPSSMHYYSGRPVSPVHPAFGMGLMALALPVLLPAAIVTYLSYRESVKNGTAEPSETGEKTPYVIAASIIVWIIIITLVATRSAPASRPSRKAPHYSEREYHDSYEHERLQRESEEMSRIYRERQRRMLEDIERLNRGRNMEGSDTDLPWHERRRTQRPGW